MSTKGTVAHVELAAWCGDQEFSAVVDAYTECFDKEANLYIQLWEQGVFQNHKSILGIPHAQAVEFAEALGKWAAAQRQHEAAKGDTDGE